MPAPGAGSVRTPASSISPAGWSCRASRTPTSTRSPAASRPASASSTTSPTRPPSSPRCAPAPRTQKGEWFLGSGWPLPAFPGANPDRALLDPIAGDRPAYLGAADGHSAWVNSRALALAGIDASTPDPPGGRIERRPGTGEPTGTLRESALGLVARLLPEPTLDERLAGLRRAQNLLLAHGVTAVQDAAVGVAELETYQAAAARGELHLKVVAAIEADLDRGPEQVADLAALRRRFSGPRLHPTAAKIFLDGVIEAHTAAMLEPYLDRPGDRGELNLPPEKLDPLVAELNRQGFDVHVHAIGDRAVRAALDAFERAAKRRGVAARRRRSAHRVRAAAPAAQPDRPPRGHRPRRRPPLPPPRRDRQLPTAVGLRRLLHRRPHLAAARPRALALDLPDGQRPPRRRPARLRQRLVGLLARPVGGHPGGGDPPRPRRSRPANAGRETMQPEQLLDLPTALAAYTIGAAWANRLEEDTGSIEVGKAADLVVLTDDLFALPAGQARHRPGADDPDRRRGGLLGGRGWKRNGRVSIATTDFSTDPSGPGVPSRQGRRPSGGQGRS